MRSAQTTHYAAGPKPSLRRLSQKMPKQAMATSVIPPSIAHADALPDKFSAVESQCCMKPEKCCTHGTCRQGHMAKAGMRNSCAELCAMKGSEAFRYVIDSSLLLMVDLTIHSILQPHRMWPDSTCWQLHSGGDNFGAAVQLHSNMLSKHGKECGLMAVIALKEAHCMN
jgi:hypothetical protein